VSPRSGLIIMLSLVFGGSAAVGVNKYVTNIKPEVQPLEKVPVVVTVADIPRGASITAGLVKTCDYPKGMVPPGTLAKVEDVLDRAVSIPLVKDEPLLVSKLAPKGAGRGLAALVPDGMRAFTIHTPNVASGVAGFILPGNRVDVLLTMDSKGSSMTTTLLQNLEILAVDQSIDAPAENKVDSKQLRSVTLLVTPDQAAKLGLAQNKGSLHLSLRNLKDDQLANTSPASLAQLQGIREEPPVKVVVEAPKPPPPRKKGVPIYYSASNTVRWRPSEWVYDTPAGAGESESKVDGPKVVQSP
jgi:pilus assembly protein CpaB